APTDVLDEEPQESAVHPRDALRADSRAACVRGAASATPLPSRKTVVLVSHQSAAWPPRRQAEGRPMFHAPCLWGARTSSMATGLSRSTPTLHLVRRIPSSSRSRSLGGSRSERRCSATLPGPRTRRARRLRACSPPACAALRKPSRLLSGRYCACVLDYGESLDPGQGQGPRPWFRGCGTWPQRVRECPPLDVNLSQS